MVLGSLGKDNYSLGAVYATQGGYIFGAEAGIPGAHKPYAFHVTPVGKKVELGDNADIWMFANLGFSFGAPIGWRTYIGGQEVDPGNYTSTEYNSTSVGISQVLSLSYFNVGVSAMALIPLSGQETRTHIVPGLILGFNVPLR